MTGRIRLTDLARQAGVSTATVSRVLNGKDAVAPSTRASVLTALDLLGYERPEKLRGRLGSLIGLVVPELSNPIFPAFAQHLESAMVLAGYTPLLCTSAAGGVTEDAYVNMLREQRVSGIIFVSGLHADTSLDVARYLKLTSESIPFVTINGKNDAIQAPDFSTDDASAISQCIGHLASLGHSKIGLAMGPSRFVPSQKKMAEYMRVMESQFTTVTPHAVTTLFTVEGGESAAAQLVAEGCTAIICGSDIMALGVIRYCNSQGLRVPEDISVTGFDDSTLMPFTNPPLTTVRQPVKAISEAAFTTLMEIISGRVSDVPSLTFTPELIVRGSTAPLQDEKSSTAA